MQQPEGSLYEPHAGLDVEAEADFVQWEKALWKRQPFEDNHVPAMFLSELDRLGKSAVRNADNSHQAPPEHSFAHDSCSTHHSACDCDCIVGSGIQQTIRAGSGTIASRMDRDRRRFGRLDSDAVWMVDWYVYRGHAEIVTRQPLRGLILPPLILSLLAPILGTLTSATTSDSVWPLAGGLFFIHLLLADFSTGPDLRLQLQRKRQREMHNVKRMLGQSKPVLEAIQEKG